MKKSFSPTFLPVIATGAGSIALLLRLGLYTLQDHNGLLPAGHPFHILSILLALCAAVFFAVTVKTLDGNHCYADNFPPSLIRGAASLICALCLLPVIFDLLRNPSEKLDFALAVLGVLSIPCLLFTGFCQWKGKQPSMLFHGILCLFFGIHMVSRYRLWSGNPQMEDYLLPLFGSVFLTLTAYHRTAFAAGMGRRRMLIFCGLTAVVCCLSSVAGEGNHAFFLAGAIWAAANLCVLTPPQDQQNSEDSHVSA